VVVVCESCSTRFKVDETRIPPKGTLVRCSRCKSTFIVKAPSASLQDTIQDVVAEVTEAGGPPTPEPSEDLFDAAGEDLGETRPAGTADDDAWEFDEAPASGSASGPAPDARPTVAAPPPPPRSSLEEIGSPEEWDLLSGSVDASARQATFREVAEPTREEAPTAARAAAAARAPSVEVAREPARPALAPKAAPLGRAVANAGKTGVATIAWLTLMLLLGVGASRVVPTGPPALVPRAVPARVIGLPDGEARGVRLRFVENAFAGTLFVVSGEVARPGADPHLGLRIHWVDAHGARLGAGAWARPEPGARELRERAPEALHAEPTAMVTGPFVAIFDAVPNDATGFELALEALPARPTPGPPDASPPAEAASAAATASSPPSPRPSSG